MNITLVRIIFIFVIFCAEYGHTIRWLAIQNANMPWTEHLARKTLRSLLHSPNNHSPCNILKKQYGFSKIQTRICRSTVDLIPNIQKASTLASRTCRGIFESKRWNCSSINSAPSLTPDLTRATREQAYVYAISSAALTYVMAQFCSSGMSHHCSCAGPPIDPPNGNFKWGGCSDNIKWGIHFSRRFLDSTEKYNYKHAKLRSQNTDKPNLSIKQLSVVNLHNNRVGRRVVSASITTQCKCHGVSGSCNIKTCWRALPRIIEIGQRLLRRYTNAIEVSKNLSDIAKTNIPEMPGLKLPSPDQLIYFTKSPDYCTEDKKLGSMGTVGRKCNITSTGMDGCPQLCCGRGYSLILEEKLVRCQCKFYDCCNIKCETCRILEEVYECI